MDERDLKLEILKLFQQKLNEKLQAVNEPLQKTPLIFDADQDERPYVHVWRVQNENGEGPYSAPGAGAGEKWWDAPHGVPESMGGTGLKHPMPREDVGFTEAERKHSGKYNHRYGFETKEHLQNWFSPEELGRLDAMGFKPTQVKAKKVWGSGKQVFFEPHEGDVKKAGSSDSGLSNPPNYDEPSDDEMLDKGERGDWQKEGYKIRHHIQNDMYGDENNKNLVVTAHTPNGDKIGHAIISYPVNERGDQPQSLGTAIGEFHRRKGLASGMYQYAEKILGQKLVPGQLEEEGKKLWAQPNRPFGKSEEAYLEDLAKAGNPDNPYAQSEGGFQPNKHIRQQATEYMQEAGLPVQHPTSYKPIDRHRGQKLASAYAAMPHDPENEAVKNSYDALKNETLAQYNKIKQSGMKFSRIEPGQPNPYSNAKDLMRDAAVGHMWYYPTEGQAQETIVGNHPMLQPTNEYHDGHRLLLNDIFRIVHDYFGHAKEGVNFSPRGEEHAWRSHVRMYSPIAAKAMTTETRGQASMNAFGPHGHISRHAPEKTIFAEQKAGLLPDWTGHEDVKKSEDLMKAPPEELDLSGDIFDLSGTPLPPDQWYPHVKAGYKHGKTKLMSNGLYHHTFHSPSDIMHAHAISDYSDPYRPVKAFLEGEADHPHAALTVRYSKQHPAFKGKGFGKLLYLAALHHHGKLESDNLVSKKATAAWKHMHDIGGAQVVLGEPDNQESPHVARLDETARKALGHKLYRDSIKGSPEPKMAKAEKKYVPKERIEPKGGKARTFEDMIRDALSDLQQFRNTPGQYGSTFASGEKPRSSTFGATPATLYSYGPHWPVVRILDNRNIAVNTHPYGGQTQQMVEKILKELPEYFPAHNIIEVNHPDYAKSAKIMRQGEGAIREHLTDAAQNHPDPAAKEKAKAHLQLMNPVEKGTKEQRETFIGYDPAQNEKVRISRISRYLNNIGLTASPHLDEDANSKRLGRDAPATLTTTPGEGPKEQQLIHETAHASQTPHGMSLREYQEAIGQPGMRVYDVNTLDRIPPEAQAQMGEAGISRRAGLSPFRARPGWTEADTMREHAYRKAKEAQSYLDEGIVRFDPIEGKLEYQNTPNAIINARAKGLQELADKMRRTKFGYPLKHTKIAEPNLKLVHNMSPEEAKRLDMVDKGVLEYDPNHGYVAKKVGNK